jgi:hypothetical protein
MAVRPIAMETLASIIPGFIAGRGYGPVYHSGEVNHCPGCGRSHWHIGRTTAECAFCMTALPLIEAGMTTPTLRRAA